MAKKKHTFSFDQDQTSNLNDLLPVSLPVQAVEETKEEEKPVDNSFTVRVIHPSLRMRRAPNTSAEIVGRITDYGKYKIVDQVNGWGKLENGNWIMLSYTEIVS
ncbi:MAG: SH3 domain-containing protein [Lachnospiraceae bacterium]|nr:SH3 domain-containing protein [Lachnospiraceae bacterium]